MWNGFPDPPPELPPDSYPVDYSNLYSDLLTSGAPYVGQHPDPPFLSLSIPSGLAHPSRAARDVLAMQQCIFCHRAETNNDFTHVKNHDGTAIQDLSCFLTGASGIVRPTFKQLADSSATCPAQVQFSVCVSATSCAPVKETRQFHELARRASYLATLLLTNDGRVPDGQFRSFQNLLLKNYGTRMVH